MTVEASPPDDHHDRLSDGEVALFWAEVEITHGLAVRDYRSQVVRFNEHLLKLLHRQERREAPPRSQPRSMISALAGEMAIKRWRSSSDTMDREVLGQPSDWKSRVGIVSYRPRPDNATSFSPEWLTVTRMARGLREDMEFVFREPVTRETILEIAIADSSMATAAPVQARLVASQEALEATKIADDPARAVGTYGQFGYFLHHSGILTLAQ